MKLGPKNVEWIFVMTLVLLAVSQFMVMTGGMITNTFQMTLMNMLLLMIFGGQLIVGIILLRIYDKMGLKGKGF
ncbi:MAG: hypothetical protein KAT91_03695 [Candidatus Aenigmarchaeota archaeon]|nr:hypothetical protein [Candidatus Aenigmarchaeota archaeon]